MVSVMPDKTMEARVRLLENLVEKLAEQLGIAYEGGQLQFSSRERQPPALSFVHEKPGSPPRSYGTIEAGDFGDGTEAFRLRSDGQSRLELSSGSDTLLQAAGCLHVNAPLVRLEARKMDLDGELSARLCQSGPFSWKSGQPPVRLVHQSHGIPVLTELKGKFRNSSSGIRLYVDPDDGYWYLAGDNSKEAEIFARVVCVGRV
ncbi:MAG: hypothetical protein J5I98_22795 [Phaeodactylibacter sp.]|nr:hypothetical protein [Phaeodactylibacter sp.]